VVEGFLEAGAGGTCFSLTNLFLQVLADLGYHASPFLADMRGRRRVHCGLLVDLPGAGRSLVDPGYLVDRPLPLREGSHGHRTRHGEVRLEGARGAFRLLTPAGGEWKERYRFHDRPAGREEFLQAWAESFAGPGMNQLCLTRGVDGGYLYLHGRHLRRVLAGGREARKMRPGDAGAAAGPFGVDPLLVARAMEVLGERRSRRG
jgi:arylamine N-acetyltransferase